MTFISNNSSNTSIDIGTDQPIEYCHDDNTAFSLLNFVINVVLLNIIGVFGIIGNVVSVIILSRPQMKSPISYLLIGIATADIVFIITAILGLGLPSIYHTTGYLFGYTYQIIPVIYPVIDPVSTILQTISVYLMLVISRERFVAVCQPLKVHSLCTYGRARLYMVMVLVFAILYNIPRFCEYAKKRCIHPHYKVPVYEVGPSTLLSNIIYGYFNIFHHWMDLWFLYCLPIAALVWFNLHIYLQVRRANENRQSLSNHQRKEVVLSTMLLWDSSVLLLCNSVSLVIDFHAALIYFFEIQLLPIKMLNMLEHTGKLLLTINSSINFLIYVTFNEKFKELFFQLFFSHG